jgi:hypothetical protein
MKKLVYFFLLICFISINAQTNDSPADNANVILVGGNVSLSFSGGTGPYDLTYTVNGGAPTTVNGVTSPYVLGGLSSGNVVAWYITDSVPTSSTTTTFTVITSPTPTPADAATGVSQLLASVSWTAFDEGGFGNGNYDVEFYGTDNTYNSVVTQSLDQPGTSFALPALNFNTSYYWRVRDTNIDGSGGNGTWFQFSFTTEIATPVLTAPADAAAGLSITPTFTWTLAGGTGGVTFDLQYHTGGGFPGTTVAGVTSGHNSTVFAYGTTYTWRIVAKKAGESDKPSTSRTFTTGNPNLLSSIANPSQGNYAVGISVLPTFTWLASAGATSYDLEVSTDPAFGTLVSLTGSNNIAGLTYTVQPFEQLNSGTLYYWRVKISAGDNVGTYSNSWEFTTHNGNLTITTYYAYGNSVNLAWLLLPSTANVKYDIYYTSDNTWATYNTIADQTNAFYTINGLNSGTNYYVRVRAKNNAGTVIIAYSSIVTFSTPGLPTPYLSYPITGATTYSNPPYLYWYTGTSFSGQYQVRYATNSSVDGGGMLNHVSADDLALTSNLFTVFPAPLTAGQTYYWQVRCYDGVTYGPWSAVESFVVYSATPTVAPVPYPSWPVGGYDYYLNPPTFFWYTGTFTTGLYFRVEWDDASDFVSILGASGWISSNLFYTLGVALPPGTYYWRVRSALDNAGTGASAWSSVASFVIPAATSTVSVPYPTAPIGTIVSTLNPTMSWLALTPPALEYRLRISPYSSTDGSGMLNHATAQSSGWTSSTSIAYNSLPSAPPALIAGVTYYWQVQSRLAAPPNTASSWSYVVSFETAAGATAIVPLVISPIQGQPINSTSAILSWALPGQPQSHLKYDVEYSKSADFTNAVRVSGVNEPVAKIDGLDKNSKYYWRVSSKNNSGEQSKFSSVGSFSTGNIATGVEPEHQVIPANFVLAQNYPNPFNPTTSITYSIPKDNFVNIKIYDMLGREVATLVNDYKNAGNHKVNWNGEDNSGQKVASGTYIYRITAGNFVATKKMVLLK